jgi:hypothetical protein
MVSLLGADDRGIGNQREMDTWVGHQVSLELGKIDVEGTIETEGSRDGGHDLTDESVQVGVGGTLNVQVTTANIIYCLIVDHEGAVRVLQGGVGGQDGVVRLNNSSGNLGSWVDGKLELGLLSVVNGETFHEKRGESRSGTSTERVEDKETLETGTLVSELTDPVQNQIDDFLSDGVVTTSIVVGSVFLSGDELFRVEQLAVGSSTDLIDYGWFQVDKDSTGNVLAGSSLAEESVERVITNSDGLVRRHLAIGLDTVLQTVEFPAGITDLDSGLSNVDRDTLTHFEVLVVSTEIEHKKIELIC